MKVDRIDLKETGKVLGKEWRQETYVENRKAENAHEKKRRHAGNTCRKEGRRVIQMERKRDRRTI
jgi:hypothetical protein